MNNHTNEKTRKSSRRPLVIGCTLALAVVAGGAYTRLSANHGLAERSNSLSVRSVATVKPKAAADTSIELPARVEAWSTAPIYARVDGYLRSWNKDIGATVVAGEELGVIETPDLDQDLQAAKSQLNLAQTEAKLASTTAKRWGALVESQLVSKQDADERLAQSQTRQAAQAAAQAAVSRLAALQGYRTLRAPFAGIVTARNTDVGALIQAGGTSVQPLFVVSDVSKLRVYVSLPQRYVGTVVVGSKAILRLPGSDKDMDAIVTSLADSIRTESGAMQVQLSVENRQAALLPGAYASAVFSGQFNGDGVALPPAALMLGKDGVRVALVQDGGRVRVVGVRITKDLGDTVIVTGAISPTSNVVISPPDGLKDGDNVQVQPAEAGNA